MEIQDEIRAVVIQMFGENCPKEKIEDYVSKCMELMVDAEGRADHKGFLGALTLLTITQKAMENMVRTSVMDRRDVK
jgi:hypothetical protein